MFRPPLKKLIFCKQKAKKEEIGESEFQVNSDFRLTFRLSFVSVLPNRQCLDALNQIACIRHLWRCVDLKKTWQGADLCLLAYVSKWISVNCVGNSQPRTMIRMIYPFLNVLLILLHSDFT